MLEKVPTSISPLSSKHSELPSSLPMNARLQKTRFVKRCYLILVMCLIWLAVLFVCRPSGFYSYPPTEMFVDAKVGPGLNRSDIVQPLLGLDDKFDIAVSIWQEKCIEWPMIEWHDSLFENAIFSDIVFQGVRLSDTEMFASITFTIPTEIL